MATKLATKSMTEVAPKAAAKPVAGKVAAKPVVPAKPATVTPMPTAAAPRPTPAPVAKPAEPKGFLSGILDAIFGKK
ncbi:hypothetical protein [Brevundimonas sp.]|uniref:hypothetical protein n=1 Tax=Brevundimonas sp. TaxID=1871086 RepID=UPI00356AA1EF